MNSRTMENSSFRLQHQKILEELERIQILHRPEIACLSREIAEVLEFIHAHLFDSTLKVKRVKQSCRIRNNNISTRFRMSVGLGIREYIEALRLESALSLLRQQRFEIYLVGMAVGYEHQETFCRAFQRHFGFLPSNCQENQDLPDRAGGLA